MHTDGKAALIRLRDAHQAQTEMLISTFQEVLQALDGDPSDPDAGQRVKAILEPHGSITDLVTTCETVMAYHGNNYLPLLWRFYVSHRRTLFRIVRVLTLTSTTQDQSLLTALTYMLSHHRTRREHIPATVDLSFASEQWQRTIVVKKRRKIMFARRHFEVCVFTYLAAELRSGDLAIAGADTYADYRLQLLPWEACVAQVASYCQEMGLPAEPQAFVTHLREWLAQTAARVDADFPTNTHVTMNTKGEPVLKRLVRKPLSLTAQALEAVIHDRFPERTLLDILCQHEQRLHWTKHFGPISGSDPKLAAPAERYIQTVFAFGCNIGAAQAARHMQGVSAHMLTFANQRHVRVETLNAAITDMINDYHRCSLPKLWGDATRAAADGTKYDLYQDNLLAEYHIRYDGYGGIAYHHVADTYIALFSHFIPCGVWEAIYLIEGLLKNTSDIQPTTIHTDTQGQSTAVFALAHLLGITLMPRIRNWKDLIFYRPSKDTHFAHLEPFFKDVIDWELIARHWQDLLQVVLSIKAGTIASSVLLRKLGNYSRKNRLYLAFRELGRVVRTAFLLEYISNLELREQVTASTNKAESYNGFAKWLFFGGEGVIAENDPEEQEKRIKYNGLVANAVILQNVRDLTRILRTLIGEGYPVRRADVVALSPYLTRGIKRFGEYTVHLDELFEEGDEGFDTPLDFPDLDSAPGATP
jgi:TnpA family transposase